MRISATPSDPGVLKRAVAPWLLGLLDNPNLTSPSLPQALRMYIYVDDIPRRLYHGGWQIDGDTLYLPGPSNNIDTFTRLSILSVIAGVTRAIEHPLVVEKITQQLVTIINESTQVIFNNVLTSTHKPERLAIDHVHLRIAAEMNGAWLMANGVPVEVDPSWTTIDF